MALSPRDRRALIILGAAVVVAAVALFLLTRDGGAPDEAAPTPTASPSPTVPAEEEPAPEEPPEEERPPRISFFAGRDPFDPLVVPPEEGEGEPTDGEPTEPTDGEPTDGEPVEPAPPGEEERREESVQMGGRTVTLVDIFQQGGEQVVQVEVDGRTFTVAVGETFSDNFRLVSIQGGCATFLFGDERFTLCEPGERK